MRSELEQLARIDAYVNNTMSAADAAAFETEMHNDAAMKEAVETQQLLITAVNRKALMAQVVAATPAAIMPPRNAHILSKFKWPIILSSVVVGAIITFFVLKPDNENLKEAHNQLHSNAAKNANVNANGNSNDTTPISDANSSNDSPPVNENNYSDFTSHVSRPNDARSERTLYGGLDSWITPDLQNFTVDPSKNELIECEDGTVIFIPKNAFATADGTPVREAVKLEVIEALTMDKIVTYNLATMNGANALKSGGMIYIQPKLNGTDLRLADGKSLHIEVPTDEYDSDMMAWEGIPDGNGNINWENPQEIENYLIPVAMSSLDFLPEGFREEVAATLPFKKHTTSTTALEDSLYYALSAFDRGEVIKSEDTLYHEAYPFNNGEIVEKEAYDTRNIKGNKNPAISKNGTQPFQLPIKVESEKRKKSKIRKGLGAVQFMNMDRRKEYTATFELNGKEYTTHVAGDTIQTDLIGVVQLTMKTEGCDPFVINNVEISPDVITLLNLKEWNCDSNPQSNTKSAEFLCEKCYIDPTSIFAIHQSEFEETFLATREFQERLQALHRIKNAQSLFELYVNQLDKNLHEIDAEVADQLSGNDKAIFEEFASQKLTNTKPNGQEYGRLKSFYDKQVKEQQKSVTKAQEQYEKMSREELRKTEETLSNLRSNYYQNRKYIESKYQPKRKNRVGQIAPPRVNDLVAPKAFNPPANIQNSNPQVGQQPAYKVNWYGTGWVNIDAYLHELSKGKKQVPIHSADNEGMKIYQSVSSLRTLLTLNATDEGYIAHFPTSQQAVFSNSLALGVCRTDEGLKVAAQFFNPYQTNEVELDNWETVSEDEFKRRLSELYPGGKNILRAMQDEQKRIREALERKERAAELRKKREEELSVLEKEFKENNAQLEAKTEAIRMRQAAERSYIEHLENFINPCHPQFGISSNDIVDPKSNEIVRFPDVDAEFPGGSIEFQRWIVNNIQYPQDALDQEISGKVYVEFVVERDGSVSNVKIRNSDPKMKLLEAEAVRLVKGLPPWKSAEVNGSKVRSRCNVPIIFTLN